MNKSVLAVAVGCACAFCLVGEASVEGKGIVVCRDDVPKRIALEKAVPTATSNVVMKATLRFDDATRLPPVDPESKFAVTALADKGKPATFRVFVKDTASNPATNHWVDTKIKAIICKEVPLVVTIKGTGNDSTALFAFDGVPFGPVPILSSEVSEVSGTGQGAISGLKCEYETTD